MDHNHHSPGDTPPKANAPSGSSQPSSQHASGSGSSSGSGVLSGGSASTGSILGSIASSAKTVASALDPRQASNLTQHGGFSYSGSGGGSSSSSSAFLGGSSSKSAAGSSSARAFQHASQALETLGGSSNNSPVSLEQQSQGFRTPSIAYVPGTTSAAATAGGGMTMDWDNFLASSESTLTEDRPYQPPTYSFESMSLLEPRVDFNSTSQSTAFPRHADQQTPTTRQLHLSQLLERSQPINLTPANHAAFLQYLRSTTAPSPPQSSQPYIPSGHQTGGGFQSHDVLRQQQLDGSDVLQFLNSTSYSDFVESVESAGLEKHQVERREFVYEDVITGPGGRLASLLSLIQNLPSERQDVVQYLLQQGTYTDDIWSRPFGHDAQRAEAASVAATLAEQDQFLQQQQSRAAADGSGSQLDKEEAEMERVLQQIVDDAKKEAETGDSKGKALDRLLMVRKHLAKL
ncbi:hypothetical protein EMPS_05499 [Entomortierella parvispora]|uniref:Uncharacterized protein n=1 Tax=Entomortierella parvispora TaxID=205924 RepID=A0A9P3HAP0_9FUNG|nr:hypothetical protein EMPS_05499 [Entomortierella parvispora]